MTRSTIVNNFFNDGGNFGYKLSTVSTRKNMDVFLWCSALVVKVDNGYKYASTWENANILINDILNGIDSQIEIPKNR